MSVTFRRLLMGMLVLFLTALMLYLLFGKRNYGMDTEVVVQDTAVDGVNGDAYFFRDETVVSYTGGSADTIGFSASGQRVQKGGVLAEVYQSPAALEARHISDRLGEQIALLIEQSKKNEMESDITLLDRQLENQFLKVLSAAAEGVPTRAQMPQEELLLLFSRRQTVEGKPVDYTSRINKLKAEQESYRQKLPATVPNVRAERAGLFMQGADGAERAVAFAEVPKLTPAELAALNLAAPPAGAIGRLITEHYWYMAVTVSAEAAIEMVPGRTMTVSVGALNGREVEVTVAAVNKSSALGDAAVILRCDVLDEPLAALRSSPVKIHVKSYTGYRVSADAVRVESGVQGVYVLYGEQVRFVPVEILWSYSGYFICKEGSEGERALRRYDEVVVKGKDLRDGKIIKREKR